MSLHLLPFKADLNFPDFCFSSWAFPCSDWNVDPWFPLFPPVAPEFSFQPFLSPKLSQDLSVEITQTPAIYESTELFLSLWCVFYGKLHSGIEVPPPKKETLLFKNKDTFFFLFLEAPFMKRSLKTHSATLKSSKSSSLLFFYGHPSSKILSLGPSADLCSWLDFFLCCSVAQMSALDAALESKWSQKNQIPSLSSLPDFPKWEVSFPISCFSEGVPAGIINSCLDWFVPGEQSQLLVFGDFPLSCRSLMALMPLGTFYLLKNSSTAFRWRFSSW